MLRNNSIRTQNLFYFYPLNFTSETNCFFMILLKIWPKSARERLLRRGMEMSVEEASESFLLFGQAWIVELQRDVKLIFLITSNRFSMYVSTIFSFFFTAALNLASALLFLYGQHISCYFSLSYSHLFDKESKQIFLLP